ncbi:MAG: DUF488 domain-containing protein [Nitrospiraceae bacterium]|nr:DUF488 domain-containing protein [Nitrospiraceae bacterium]
MARHAVVIKRIYESPSRGDGIRVLVDRLWPRGLSKSRANVDVWLRDIAPSTDLRVWFNHDPAKWKEFCVRYRAELRLKRSLVADLRRQVEQGPVTLLYGARDERFNQAAVLAQLLNRPKRPPTGEKARKKQPPGSSGA